MFNEMDIDETPWIGDKHMLRQVQHNPGAGILHLNVSTPYI